MENRWDSDGSGAFGHARLNKLNPKGETEEICRNELYLLANFLDAELLWPWVEKINRDTVRK